MAYAIIVLILLVALAPLWHFMPTRRQKHQARLREAAALAGLFHGYAYGEAVVGAGMDAILAYLAGFAIVQMAIAVGAYGIAKQLTGNAEGSTLNLRFAGFALAGVGAAFLSSVFLG